MHVLLCAKCNQEIKGKDYRTRNRKRYHNECYAELIAQAEQLNGKKAESFKSNERETLVVYICRLYGIETISYAIDKQIEHYVNQLNYTYTGIQKALYYHHEMKENPVGEYTVTIGIVPYIYDEAKAFFLLTYEADEANKGFIADEKTVTVRIKPKDRSIPLVMNIEDI